MARAAGLRQALTTGAPGFGLAAGGHFMFLAGVVGADISYARAGAFPRRPA